MNGYIKSSLVLAVPTYIYLWYEIVNGTVEQNVATWISWVLLDLVTSISLYVERGRWELLAGYVVGGSTITACIFRYSKFTWGVVETICFILVIVSIIIWERWGPWYATVISTAGVVVATYPQIKDAILTPDTMPVEVFASFGIINALGVAGGKDWSVKERLNPSVCVVLCVAIVGFSARKYFP